MCGEKAADLLTNLKVTCPPPIAVHQPVSTTVITPSGKYRYQVAPQGFLAARDAFIFVRHSKFLHELDKNVGMGMENQRSQKNNCSMRTLWYFFKN